MEKYFLSQSTYVPFGVEVVFSYLCQESALHRLLPPYLPVQVTVTSSVMQVGEKIPIVFRFGPFSYTGVFVHLLFDPKRHLFIDQQIKGPFCYWRHEHWVQNEKEGSSVVDTIAWIKPFYIPKALIIKGLNRLWRFREVRMKNDLTALMHYPKSKRKILVTGASGLVGSELVSFLQSANHDVFFFKRKAAPANGNSLTKEQIATNPSLLGDFDTIIHLAGENVAKGRWSKKRKRQIEKSRTDALIFFKEALEQCKIKPRLFLSASAVGFYGSCQDRIVDEESPAGDDFLAKVSSTCEKRLDDIEALGICVVKARLGYVMSPKGGMLKKILPLFKWGLGARIGDGSQLQPWVAIDDVIYALYHLMLKEGASGPFNITAPAPVTQKDFAKDLAKALHRPLLGGIPAFAIKLALGEMGKALLLSSIGASPKKLLSSGYRFTYTDLDAYFRDHL